MQDTWLFEGSIRDNIVYGRENVSDEEVKRVCKAVGMHHFIKTLPEGYNTIINDKMNLSEGQKQLLTIARAMIENAPMLILDEATSSVDTRTEILIQQAMDNLIVSYENYKQVPLPTSVAMSQGYIGIDLQNAIKYELYSQFGIFSGAGCGGISDVGFHRVG